MRFSFTQWIIISWKKYDRVHEIMKSKIWLKDEILSPSDPKLLVDSVIGYSTNWKDNNNPRSTIIIDMKMLHPHSCHVKTLAFNMAPVLMSTKLKNQGFLYYIKSTV